MLGCLLHQEGVIKNRTSERVNKNVCKGTVMFPRK